MSMTESEVLEELKTFPINCLDFKENQALQIAIDLLEQYRAIGTVSEYRQLKEKATAKKPIYSDYDENEDEEIIPYKAVCPVCGYEFEFGTWNDEENHHCECGQRMLWE